MFNNVNGSGKPENKVDDIFAETEGDNNTPSVAASGVAKEVSVNVGSSGLSSIADSNEVPKAKKKKMSFKAVAFIVLVILVVALTVYLAYSKFFSNQQGSVEENNNVSGQSNQSSNANNAAPIIEEPTVTDNSSSTPTSTEPTLIATTTQTAEEPMVGDIVSASTTNQVDISLDSDSDALSDIEEQMLGTDLANPDTDGDGLSDYEEIKVYNSNPLLIDTDGDGYSDLEEVRNGYNPNGPGKLGA